MSNKHNALARILNDLSTLHGLSLCVKDYTGFIAGDKELKQVLLPYLGHNNAYCLFIKKNKDRYRHCLCMMKKMAAASLERGCTYQGACYAGIREVVVPIFTDTRLQGVITAGFLPMSKEEAYPRIQRAMADASPGDQQRALELYQTHIASVTTDVERHLPTLEFIAAYLSACCRQTIFDLDSRQLIAQKRKEIGVEAVCRQAIDFINQHVSERISVSAIADVCHLSPSTISHIFKKHVGFSLSAYVNRLRIERAKEMLLNANETIESICLGVGISDPNYFSRLFKQMTGHTPTEFRIRYR